MRNITLTLLLLMYGLMANAQGPDVNPSNISQHNQIEAKVDVAFNGWIYEAHSFTDYAHNDIGIWVSVSKDAGRTWQTLVMFSGPDVAVPKFDIAVAGQDTNNLKLYIARTYSDLQNDVNALFVSRHNANTGANEATLLSKNNGNRDIYDVQLASDYMFPAVGAQPYSIACAYTCQGTIKDSLHVLTSANGGVSFGPVQTVTATSRKLNKVAIAYGYSPSASNGRYFLAWEEFSNANDTLGHIYTARHTTNISLGFTAPTNLDSLNSAAIGKCRNPTIAVSQTLEDNDSASATVLVMAEYDNTSNAKGYDIAGFYNQKAHNGTYWQQFTYNSFNTTNQVQPCLAFDTLNRLFMLTYYDNEGGNMSHFGKSMNMPSPTNWSVMTANYTDEAITHTLPYPKLRFNAAMKKAVYVWTGNPVQSNTQILFDAGYRYTIIEQQDTAICQGSSFIYNGVTVTSEGYYYDTLAIPLGDSIIELWVGIDSAPQPVIEQTGSTLSTQTYIDYQWMLQGMPIPLANQQSYTVAENGNYTVLVTASNGCQGESEPLSVNGVGINEIDGGSYWVYPNPCSHTINVLGITGHNNLYIVDVLGNVVEQLDIKHKTTFNIQHLAPGSYTLYLSSPKGVRGSTFIKTD